MDSAVRKYYVAATEDYLKYYQAHWHHHMHYGFDRDLPKGGNPTEHMVRYLAKIGGLREGERVLDAGCGVGGSSILLSRAMGCRCVGITLVEGQAKLARSFAATGKAGGIPARVREQSDSPAPPGPESAGPETFPRAAFVANDFNRPSFKAGSFDAVWALESFDHAEDKESWIRTMFGLLKPGGRLVIADGFRAAAPATKSQAAEYARFLAGWAVPHLCSVSELRAYAARAGFETVHGEDISGDVMPHARAIFRFGLIFIPLRWILAKMGLTSPEKLGNAYATFFQYRTFKHGLWTYGAFCFRKPAQGEGSGGLSPRD